MLKRIFSIFYRKKYYTKPVHYYEELLSEAYVRKLMNENDFIDGRNGGLVLGNSHANGGVIFLFQYSDGFRVYGELEGHEFVINRDSAEKYRKEINEINNHERDYYGYFDEYKIPKNVKVIDARMKNNRYKYLLLDVRGGFAIINKYSTKLHLERLDFINKN